MKITVDRRLTELPVDSILVVRMESIRDFERRIEEEDSAPVREMDLSEGKQSSLQKQVAALALVLAEKSAKYKNGDKPNANQIAEAVALMLNAMPDANTHGVSSASLRASIKAGITMLQGKLEESE